MIINQLRRSTFRLIWVNVWKCDSTDPFKPIGSSRQKVSGSVSTVCRLKDSSWFDRLNGQNQTVNKKAKNEWRKDKNCEEWCEREKRSFKNERSVWIWRLARLNRKKCWFNFRLLKRRRRPLSVKMNASHRHRKRKCRRNQDKIDFSFFSHAQFPFCVCMCVLNKIFKKLKWKKDIIKNKKHWIKSKLSLLLIKRSKNTKKKEKKISLIYQKNIKCNLGRTSKIEDQTTNEMKWN